MGYNLGQMATPSSRQTEKYGLYLSVMCQDITSLQKEEITDIQETASDLCHKYDTF